MLIIRILKACESNSVLSVAQLKVMRRFKEGLKYPGPYAEIALEQEYKNDTAIWCELTFWAVKLLDIVENFNK